MSIKVKKNSIKLIVGLLLIIALVIVGIFVTKNVSKNMEIKEIQEKLSQISISELQEKIIDKLENSKMNVQSSAKNLGCVTMFDKAPENLKGYDGYILASTVFMKNGNVSDYCAIPCFKINGTNNGKFKSIEYLADFGSGNVNDRIVADIIEEIFKNDYGINLSSYNEFNNYNIGKELNIDANDDTLVFIFSMIDGEEKSNNNISHSEMQYWKKCTMNEFGINVK